MKFKWINGWLLVSFLLAFGDAYGAPQFNYYLAGSSFQVDATNSEDRAYSCSISYVLKYVQHGEAGSQRFQNTFGVRGNWQGNVLLNSTGWAASTLSYENVNIRCN